MVWRVFQLPGIAGLCLIALIAFGTKAHGRALDTKGEINLGFRAYASTRIQTEDTDRVIFKEGPDENAGQFYRSLTFPISKAGQMRQARYFMQLELSHDIQRLYEEKLGPLALLHALPFDFSNLRYQLIYRGEGDGAYDFGSRGFRTRDQYHLRGFPNLPNANVPEFSGNSVQSTIDPATGQTRLDGFRDILRDKLSNRNRLFQAFVDFQVGDMFIRAGRQILVWGETDAFRLMDNINPVDNGFGGFLIPLDERRVPLDMIRANYYLGDLDKVGMSALGLQEAYVEAFWAIDNAVGWFPGINIKGSPWALPNLGEPSATQYDLQNPPARNIENSRGGFQFKFNTMLPAIEDATFGFAHYYTFFDTPQVRSYVSPSFPLGVSGGHPIGNTIDTLGVTVQEAELTQVTGLTGTFAIPATWARLVGLTGEPIVRSELAYFKNEPRHQQEQLDPFTYHLAAGCGASGPGGSIGSYIESFGDDNGLCTGGKRPGDSWNFVLGIDTNQFVQWLNARNSFFITTQFFYKHLNGASRRETLNQRFERLGIENVDPLVPEYFVTDANNNRVRLDIPPIYAGEVLPVPAFRQRSALTSISPTATQPSLARSSTDQFLQTLLISTQYASGQIVPTLTMVYDWAGAVGVIPQITFLRDPFRLTMSYSYLEANSLKGNAGVSLLRDRDNFLFQIEYVI